LRPDPPTFERSGDLRRRLEIKTLDQPVKSGHLDIKRQATFGMSGKMKENKSTSPSLVNDLHVAATSKLVEALVQSESKIRLRLDLLSEVVFEIRPSGEIEFLNRAWVAVGGQKVESLRGKPFAILFVEEDRPKVEALIAEPADIHGGRSMTCRIARPDGRECWVELSAVAVPGTGWVGTMRDVTLEYNAKEALRHMERLESIGKLTGGVAHDFNNLLTVITASVELLASLPETSLEQAGLLDAIKLAAGRGVDLTSSLLSFSRKKPLAPKTIHVGAVVDEIADLLGRTLPAFIRLRCAVDPRNWTIEADPTQINTALLNLIVNSADAMPSGGEISVNADCLSAEDVATEAVPELRSQDYVRIRVVDAGVGMSPEVLRHACDPFFTTKEIGKGSGLGLSMVWGFVQQSGGQMDVRSAPLRGTSVSLYLPRSIAAVSNYRVSDVGAGLARGKGELVLVVEDDPMLRPQVVSMIRALNYQVVAMERGEEALSYIRSGAEVDLVFTDLIMPGKISGKDLADEVREKYPGLKVLLTSGYADEANIGKALVDDTVSFLAKPYKMNDLSIKLRNLLVFPT
jgi:PAS domain S-box-containing protein